MAHAASQRQQQRHAQPQQQSKQQQQRRPLPQQPGAKTPQEQLHEQYKQMASTYKCMQQSTRMFAEFIRRPDVLQNQDAKLAAMHMAAAFVDGGQSDTFKVIAHCKVVIKHILAL